jgi:hypothetical protein
MFAGNVFIGKQPKRKLPACSAHGQLLFSEQSYFFLRLKKPAAIDPNPSRLNSGSGEAVCGSFFPAAAL